MVWTCPACENENPADAPACEACDEPAPAAAAPPSGSRLILVAKVLELAPVPGKDKLRLVTLDVGSPDPIAVVTSAPNLSVSALCVVALPGATVRIDNEDVAVKAATVGGVRSHGMLCDAPMLGWVGGGAGMAALVPEGPFAVGDAPPDARPRMK